MVSITCQVCSQNPLILLPVYVLPSTYFSFSKAKNFNNRKDDATINHPTPYPISIINIADLQAT